VKHPRVLHLVYVRIRQHTSAYVSIRQHTSADQSETSAGASPTIRPHTSAYVSIRQRITVKHPRVLYLYVRTNTSAYVQHTFSHAFSTVSIRQHTSAHVSIRQSMSAYVSIRQHEWHASAYVSMRVLHLEVRTLATSQTFYQ
jgi:hypothetical protein